MIHKSALPTLNHQQIFAFWWQLSQFAPYLSTFYAMLSADEQRRANRFIHPLIKERFVIARGVLRYIIAHYGKQSAEGITFAYGTRGKPSVPDLSFDFNLSHSEDIALLALAHSPHIGVDVEYMNINTDIHVVSRDYFSENEQAMLQAQPTSEQRASFYRCWTRKEAYIKARGDGFALPLGRFDVSLAADEPPRLLRAEDDDIHQWQFFHLVPMQEYIGAICLPVGHWTLEIHQITPSSVKSA